MINRKLTIEILGALHPNALKKLDVSVSLTPEKKLDETEFYTLRGALLMVIEKLEELKEP